MVRLKLPGRNEPVKIRIKAWKFDDFKGQICRLESFNGKELGLRSSTWFLAIIYGPWPVDCAIEFHDPYTYGWIVMVNRQRYIIILFLEKFERYLKCESRNSLLNYEKVKFHFSSMFIISSVGDPRSWFPLIRNFSKVVGPLSLRVSGPYPDRTNWFWTNRLWSVDTWVAYHSRYPKGHCLVKMHR